MIPATVSHCIALHYHRKDINGKSRIVPCICSIWLTKREFLKKQTKANLYLNQANNFARKKCDSES